MLSRRHSALLNRFACALAGATLSACSIVPSSGPSREAVVYASAQQVPPYLLVRLSDFVVQKLLHFPGPSLYGKFGDYRGPREQTVGIGDTVTVTLFEAAGGGLFSQPVADSKQVGSHSAVLPPQIVQRDGSITVPYAGRVPVDGKNTHEIERYIVEKLTGKAIEPQVVVALSKNIASAVTVIGEGVQGTGAFVAGGDPLAGTLRIPMHVGGDRLLDIVADAGGLKTPAHETFLELTRGGRTVRVPFQTVLNNPKENIYARPDDVLTVIRYPLTFTSIGATGQNAVVPFDAVGISLAEAVGKSAGLTDGRADPEGVFVFRYEPATVVRDYPGLTPQQAALNLVPVVYVLNMRDPRSLFLARKFSMHDKDIVYVSNSPYVELGKLIAVFNAFLSPVLNGVSLGQTIAGASNAGNNLSTLANTANTNSLSATTGSGSSLGNTVTTTTGIGGGGG